MLPPSNVAQVERYRNPVVGYAAASPRLRRMRRTPNRGRAIIARIRPPGAGTAAGVEVMRACAVPLNASSIKIVPAPFSERVAACHVVRHPQAVGASDHFPVVADLIVEET